MQKIGFIGMGIMGASMARNLKKAGYELQVYTRTRKKAEPLVEEGARYCATAAECVEGCDAVITMVGFPEDVEEVYFGPEGILNSAAPGTYLIDMTTTKPELAERIYAAGKERGLLCLDAPVTGGDTGARNATLSILVGGDREDYQACRPLFEAMGTNIQYHGKAGSGQHAKMVNQIMIAGTMAGVCEALTYMKAKGLDPETVLASVSTGAAGSNQLNAYGKKILEGDFAPGFFVKHFIKDMNIALEESKKNGLELNVLELVLGEYQKLAKQGCGDLGTQALVTYYKKDI